jgi:YD repeat-containing protein
MKILIVKFSIFLVGVFVNSISYAQALSFSANIVAPPSLTYSGYGSATTGQGQCDLATAIYAAQGWTELYNYFDISPSRGVCANVIFGNALPQNVDFYSTGSYVGYVVSKSANCPPGQNFGVSCFACPAGSIPSGLPNFLDECTCDAANGFIGSNLMGNGCVDPNTSVSIINSKNPAVCPAKPVSMSIGAPIIALQGSKLDKYTLGILIGPNNLTLTYDTSPILDTSLPTELNQFGKLWDLNTNKRVIMSPQNIEIANPQLNGANGFGLSFVRGDSSIDTAIYNNNTASYVMQTNLGNRVVYNQTLGALVYTDAQTGTIETYNKGGYINSIVDASGNSISYLYSMGLTVNKSALNFHGYDVIQLTAIKDNVSGRTMQFTYSVLPSGQSAVTSIADAANSVFNFTYDANSNLSSIIWPDGKVKTFLYENASFPWANTRIIDENNNSYEFAGYDAAGHANNSYLAGGVENYSINWSDTPTPVFFSAVDAATGLNVTSAAWSAPASTSITQPNGQINTIAARIQNGYAVPQSMTQPAGSGCGATSSSSAVDVNGNTASRDDFNGSRTCYAYDSNSREITRVEGLSNTVDCSTVTPINAILPAGAKKISTTYDPMWNTPVFQASPLSTMTTVYNGSVDPTTGSISSCSAATIAGNPLPVICKTIDKATTDLTGAQGINPTIDATAQPVINNFTYDANGRMLTSQDGLSRTTSLTYYSDSIIDGINLNNVAFGYLIAPDGTSSSTTLLIHGNGANGSTVFADNSVNPKTITAVAPAQISTAQSLFGESSLYFPGSGYATVPSSNDLVLGTGDFTVELWVNPTGASAADLLDFRPTATNGAYITLDLMAGNYPMFYVNGTTMEASSVPIPTGTWGHIALVRASGITRLYVNGIYQPGYYLDSNSYSVGSNGLIIAGNGFNGSSVYNGYMSDIRIANGIALYTANFTPPAAQFSNPVAVHITANSKGHTMGDLQSITDPAGNVTTFDLYDPNGRVLQTTDPKGVVTQMSYTPRGWVSTVVVTPPGLPARTTSYGYDAVGQLIQVNAPDGTVTNFSYDAAHRLIGATDAKGNSVSYTLDNMGNHIAEQVLDPSGNLQRSITRSFDALNRLQQVSGAVH